LKETEEKLKETHEKYLAANEELLEWNEEVNQLNNQLNKLNQHYSLISEYSSDLVTSYDNQLNLTYVSDSVLPFLGYTPEEYQSLKISEVIHPNDYYPLLRLIASLMVSANRPHFVECRLKHKNNGFSRVELTAQIINK
jgi:PAS domain S-box-containing protein